MTYQYPQEDDSRTVDLQIQDDEARQIMARRLAGSELVFVSDVLVLVQ